MEEKIYSKTLNGRQRFVPATLHHLDQDQDHLDHDQDHLNRNRIIYENLRSVVIEEGVVTADGLAVDWVSSISNIVVRCT